MGCVNSVAHRRYQRRVIWLTIAYAVTLVAAVYGFRYHLLSGAAAYLAAILPAFAIIGVFFAIGRYLLEEQDEYLRMLMVRQALWASGFALSIATIWGFLENFDLAGHIESYYISVLWFGGLAIGAGINRFAEGRDA